MEDVPEEPVPTSMPPPVPEATEPPSVPAPTIPPSTSEPPPPPRGPGWGAILVVVVVVAAIVAIASAVAITSTLPRAPAVGENGPGGGVLEQAFIMGQAVVTDCDIAPSSFIMFKIQYVNLGNTSATDVVAQYIVYQFETPTIIRSGTVSIGTVEAHSSGSVSERLSTVECGLWGHNVEVSFTWT